MKNQTLNHLFLVILIVLFSSCAPTSSESTLESTTRPLTNFGNNFWIKKYPDNVTNTSQVNSQQEPNETANQELTSIELMWLVPQGRITKYVLRYGVSSDHLDLTKEISVKSLIPVLHPKLGKVYKYILHGVPKSKIYYTLQAGNEFGLSDPTPVGFEKPQE